MFILPGLLGLVTFMFTRPLDFMESLRDIPFLYLFVALAVVGYVIDVGAGNNRFIESPQLRVVIMLLGWCLATLAIKASWQLGQGFIELAIIFILFFLMAHGIRSLKAFEQLGGVLLLCTLWISLVCVHQGLQPPTCVALPENANHTAAGVPTGIACEDNLACYKLEDDPEVMFRCEHVGWFGLSSVRYRVRYAGVLHDPNEVALAVAVGVPIAIARVQRRRRKRLWDVLVLLVTLALTGMTVVLSQSRGGQLVFLAVLGVYFLRRYRVWGLLASGVAALPLLLLGGRSGAEASESALERLGCWDAGITMLRANPGFGVGFRQFLQHHHLTAHNSFVLTAGELGLVGMTLFSGLLLLSVKLAYKATKQLTSTTTKTVKSSRSNGTTAAATALINPDTQQALRAWGDALVASIIGLSVGVFFLSFAYHYVLWIYLGFVGAYYAAVRSYLPSLRVALKPRDWLLILLGNVALLVALATYVRFKLG